MQVWREDGVPANLPMFITESNLSPEASETYMDMFSGIWLADYIGSFLNAAETAFITFTICRCRWNMAATILRERSACSP